MRERLTLRPCERPAPAWLLDALASLARDAYDHPDYQERRAALLELAATEDRLRQLAQRAAYGSVLTEMAEQVAEVAGALLLDNMRWDDDRDWRELGTAADRAREMVQ